MQAYSDTMDELERRDDDRDGAIPRDKTVKAAETAATFYYALAVDSLVTADAAAATAGAPAKAMPGSTSSPHKVPVRNGHDVRR